MATVSTTDLRAVLAVLYDLGSLTPADPFPLPVLDRLGTLLGAHRTGYGEFSIEDGGRSYSTLYLVQNHTEPAWLAETVARLWHQDPITCRVHARALEPMAISDRVSMSAFRRLEFFQDVHRPFGTADSIRLFLPAPNAMSRFFFFDQEHWGLKQRERDLLALLRPHLALWRSRWSVPASARRKRANRSRTGSPPGGRGRPDEPRDCRPALDLSAHRQNSPPTHLRKARRPHTHRSRRTPPQHELARRGTLPGRPVRQPHSERMKGSNPRPLAGQRTRTRSGGPWRISQPAPAHVGLPSHPSRARASALDALSAMSGANARARPWRACACPCGAGALKELVPGRPSQLFWGGGGHRPRRRPPRAA